MPPQQNSHHSLITTAERSPKPYKLLESFHIICVHLCTILHGTAIFEAQCAFSRRGERCDEVRPLARTIRVEEIHFIPYIQARFLHVFW